MTDELLELLREVSRGSISPEDAYKKITEPLIKANDDAERLFNCVLRWMQFAKATKRYGLIEYEDYLAVREHRDRMNK